MKLRQLAVILMGLAVLGMGLWGTMPSRSYMVAKNKSKGTRIEKEDSGKDKGRRIRTKFALDSIRANQILLLTKKEKITSE